MITARLGTFFCRGDSCKADFPGTYSKTTSHDVYFRIKAELSFGRDVEITTLIAAERPTLINFNTAAIAPPDRAI